MATASDYDGPLYAGIDGGGSKCKVIIVTEDNQVLGEGLSGPANPVRGLQVATESILAATQQALTQAGLVAGDKAKLIVGAGLAGVNVPEYYRIFSQWQHPFQELHLTSDLHVACIGAHSGGDGAVIIAGTGSCGLADVRGQLLEVGGHGFPYGDNGSGAWIGLQMVHHVLLAKDLLGPDTQLTSLLCHELQREQALALVDFFMHATPTTYARYAPLVFTAAEQGDTVALQILRQAAAHIDAIAYRLLSLNPPRLCLIGGLADKLSPYLASELRQQITPALASPELGAIWFAKQCRLNSQGLY